MAQVRSRVNGVVLERSFQEGSEVKAGQLLFQIDAAPYRAAIDSAQAALAKAQAGQTQAARYRVLADANAISTQEYQAATAASLTAQADVNAGRAAVQTARISLGYANVTAPIGGRIGRALVTEGALVSAAEATPLSVIGCPAAGSVRDRCFELRCRMQQARAKEVSQAEDCRVARHP